MSCTLQRRGLVSGRWLILGCLSALGCADGGGPSMETEREWPAPPAGWREDAGRPPARVDAGSGAAAEVDAGPGPMGWGDAGPAPTEPGPGGGSGPVCTDPPP